MLIAFQTEIVIFFYMQGLRLWGVTSRSTVFEDKLGQILFISFLNSASQSLWARTPGKTIRKQVWEMQ